MFLSVNYSHVNVIVHTPFLIGDHAKKLLFSFGLYLHGSNLVILSYFSIEDNDKSGSFSPLGYEFHLKVAVI